MLLILKNFKFLNWQRFAKHNAHVPLQMQRVLLSQFVIVYKGRFPFGALFYLALHFPLHLAVN